MFTGLIEKIGELAEFKRGNSGSSLRIVHDEWASALHPGESIAVQGVCVTVTSCSEKEFTCNLLDETLYRTNLASKRIGSVLNLERALRIGDRLGGHIISGHVDATGHVEDRRRTGEEWTLRIRCDQKLFGGIVPKGSIACDGVSLTITAILMSSFEVDIIPFTWKHTTLSFLGPGDTVNLETDILGKYVCRYMEGQHTTASSLDMDSLKTAGLV